VEWVVYCSDRFFNSSKLQPLWGKGGCSVIFNFVQNLCNIIRLGTHFSPVGDATPIRCKEPK